MLPQLSDGQQSQGNTVEKQMVLGFNFTGRFFWGVGGFAHSFQHLV